MTATAAGSAREAAEARLVAIYHLRAEASAVEARAIRDPAK